MAQKRKPKQGYVYLLKSKNMDGIYKFGCTTLDPEKRCKKVNLEKKDLDFDFYVICSFKSFDIYADESKVKGEILCGGFGFLSEVIDIGVDDELNSDSDIIKRFLYLGGILSKGVEI